ncbi:ABC transporter ATP-binding protein [Paenibacillus eucommiae]|uniref:ABC-2 type transport system ATP-binding protein n=1 Tax=Paenibacillus eucommiae TaxID=1355755 RepID=A0ABS4J9U6_9BACL|nr:ATP-binding cassette domain-containing protein [Paenibacillus eucommiae]MBP1996570.1 ABC-2 type transport system ATP-binding protein [Paenibacillus eucommiae]
MIVLENVSKKFKVSQRKKGLFNFLMSAVNPKYSTKLAVDNLNFSIAPGEIVGYIGPNGAGKSTTIKMLCGILTPSEGKVWISGLDPSNERNRKKVTTQIGVVFGQRTQLWMDLPLVDSLRLNQKIYGIDEKAFQQQLKLFDDTLSIGSFLHTPVRQLSLGQRMRGDLVASLLHRPSILFLDEPTIGLDVLAKDALRKMIREINHQYGVTVILTTHDMSDIEETCKRIILIDNGTLQFDGSLDDIKQKYGSHRTLFVEFYHKPAQLHLPELELLKTVDNKYWYSFDYTTSNPSDLLTKIAAQAAIKDLSVNEIKVEDIIRQIYSERKLMREGLG